MLAEPTNKPTEEPTYIIVGKKDVDSTGSRSWTQYLNPDYLGAVWMPPPQSPYNRYWKPDLVASAPGLDGKIQPRYSEGEKQSEAGLKNLIQSGVLGKTTAVILDSGGAHSVAMAVELMKRGYQPVFMLNNRPHPNGSNRAEQGLATMLYFAEEVRQLKEQGAFDASSPPVFIMDCHRSDKPFSDSAINNSYSYSSQDLPSASVLKNLGIKTVVYLNEGDQHGQINPDFQSTDRLRDDLKPVVAQWNKEGMVVKYTGVAPWANSLKFPSNNYRPW